MTAYRGEWIRDAEERNEKKRVWRHIVANSTPTPGGCRVIDPSAETDGYSLHLIRRLGYLMVQMRVGGKRVSLYAHQLGWEARHSRRAPSLGSGFVISHFCADFDPTLDDDRKNCCAVAHIAADTDSANKRRAASLRTVKIKARADNPDEWLVMGAKAVMRGFVKVSRIGRLLGYGKYGSNFGAVVRGVNKPEIRAMALAEIEAEDRTGYWNMKGEWVDAK